MGGCKTQRGERESAAERSMHHKGRIPAPFTQRHLAPHGLSCHRLRLRSISPRRPMAIDEQKISNALQQRDSNLSCCCHRLIQNKVLSCRSLLRSHAAINMTMQVQAAALACSHTPSRWHQPPLGGCGPLQRCCVKTPSFGRKKQCRECTDFDVSVYISVTGHFYCLGFDEAFI